MTNSKFQELLSKLKSLKLKQTGVWEDDMPDDIYEEYFSDFEILNSNLDPQRHRWCEYSTKVVKVQGGLLGIYSISNVYSENMGISDFEEHYRFFEMKEQVTTTYVPV